MKAVIKIIWNCLLWLAICFASFNYETSIYIFYQACGQLSMLKNTTTFEEFKKSNQLSEKENYNLELINVLKKYSEDSLGFKPTKNFSKIFDQGDSPTLWAVTASKKYKIEPYYWTFPIVGKVSYKGFFEKKKAEAEKNKLICMGYDVDLRSVTAWSTLGWFNDPVLSSMLDRSKGSLCNLIFHELFHATYYAESSVDYNENLASFIAHKATLQFLKKDTSELNSYENNYKDNLVIEKHMGAKLRSLNLFYDSISNYNDAKKFILKTKKLFGINSSLNTLPIKNQKRLNSLRKNILDYKNAWFVDFEQYNGLQDSLEGVFNKIYNSEIRKMVQSLK